MIDSDSDSDSDCKRRINNQFNNVLLKVQDKGKLQ